MTRLNGVNVVHFAERDSPDIVNMFIEPIEFHLPEVTSTNDYAKELLGTYPYVFVSAQHQTKGRGRNGKDWIGDHFANAYCSIGIAHTQNESIEELSAYMARGALAVVDTLRGIHPDIRIRLKYPNDVQAFENGSWSKLAGILVEHEFRGMHCSSTIVGIGINVDQALFPETITQRCTSLRLLGLHSDVDRVIAILKQSFTSWRHRDWKLVHDLWVTELDIHTKLIRLTDADGIWTLRKVLPDGRLILRNDVSRLERTISDGDTLRYED